MELRAVDPRKLKANPANPRRTAAAEHLDAQLVASIRALGIIQPPLVQEQGRKLIIVAGHRRVAAAVEVGLPEISVLVQPQADGLLDPMRSVSENLIRAEMGPVDRWRSANALAGAGWTEDAIASALGLTPRAVAQLRLLADICPAMLDQMARGDIPNERELRVIAAATGEEQAQVWKRNRPKRGERAHWPVIAQALAKERFYARDAQFGADEAAAFGLVWEEDLFAPAGEDSRSTTQLDAYIGAQQAWLEANLPEGGTIVTTDEYGRLQLPRGARERWTSKPAEGDLVALAVDPRTGKVRQTVYELAQRPTSDGAASATGETLATPRPRPDVTQKGATMIGDLRTEALHQALREQPIDDDQLLGMLVLALSGNNVEVRSGVANRGMGGVGNRARIAETLTEGGVLTRDPDALRHAAREMLVEVLSCRVNHSASGMAARYAGSAIDADTFLPTMATEEFLPCLSKAALERAANAQGVPPGQRAKDTRAALIEWFQGGRFVYPEARFAPSDAELLARRDPGTLMPGLTSGNEEDDAVEEGAELGEAGPNAMEEAEPEGDGEGAAAGEDAWPNQGWDELVAAAA